MMIYYWLLIRRYFQHRQKKRAVTINKWNKKTLRCRPSTTVKHEKVFPLFFYKNGSKHSELIISFIYRFNILFQQFKKNIYTQILIIVSTYIEHFCLIED